MFASRLMFRIQRFIRSRFEWFFIPPGNFRGTVYPKWLLPGYSLPGIMQSSYHEMTAGERCVNVANMAQYMFSNMCQRLNVLCVSDFYWKPGHMCVRWDASVCVCVCFERCLFTCEARAYGESYREHFPPWIIWPKTRRHRCRCLRVEWKERARITYMAQGDGVAAKVMVIALSSLWSLGR